MAYGIILCEYSLSSNVEHHVLFVNIVIVHLWRTQRCPTVTIVFILCIINILFRRMLLFYIFVIGWRRDTSVVSDFF